MHEHAEPGFTPPLHASIALRGCFGCHGQRRNQ
jgi:hypothetical protein